MSSSPPLDSSLATLLEAVVRDELDVGLTLLDGRHDIVFANAAAARFVGVDSPAALVGRSGSAAMAELEVFTADGRAFDFAAEVTAHVLRGGVVGETLLRFRRRGTREERWSLARARPLRNAAGAVTHALHLFREVTEERRDDDYRRFLLQADAELSSSLEYEKTLATVARLAVPVLADWCAVDLRIDGERKRVAVAHVDPAKIAFVDEIERRYPPDPDAPTGAPQILRSGKAELLPEIPRQLLLDAAVDDEHLKLIEQVDLRSYMGVPLRGRSGTIGALTFAMAESHRHYSERDLQFAQALADRAALAIENARLYSEAEQDLANSEANFRLMISSVKDYAIFMLDPKGRVASWNAGAQLIKGYSAKEIIGQHFSKFYTEEAVRSGFCDKELAEAARVGRFEDEGWRVRKDGSRFWANVVISAIFDGDGRLRGFAKVTRDLTERKRAEEQLRAEVDRRIDAEETSRLAQLFVGVLGHDLRNPLNAILTGASYLGRIATSDKQMRTIARIMQSGERMARMIAQLLDYTRLGIGGGLTLEVQSADLGDVVQSVVDELAAAYPGVVVHLQREGDLAGSWDAARLEQALSNLLGNAIQHGTRDTPVSLRVEGRRERMVVTLHNHGAIDPTQLPNLFAPFKPLKMSAGSSGLGLGLYISKQIIQGHGGEIQVRSTPSDGTTFVITLPRQCATFAANAK